MDAELYTLSMRLFRRKENGVFYIQFDRLRKESLHTRDEIEAKREFKARLRGKVRALDPPKSKPLSEVISLYMVWAEENLSDTTLPRLRAIKEKFLAFIGGQKSVGGLDFADMDRYVSHCRKQKIGPVTINVEIRHIKAIFGWAAHKRRGIIKENPFEGYEQVKYHKAPVGFLTVEEIKRVFEKIGTNRRYRLIFALYVYTGARREEIHRLEWKDIKAETILIRESKTYKAREIDISASLRAILKEYPRGAGKIIGGSLDQMGARIKGYLRDAGLGHFRPHDLRHTFASHLLLAGVDITSVSRLLGHTTPNITLKTYSHVTREHLKRAVAKLPY